MLWAIGYIFIACVVLGLGVVFDDGAKRDAGFWIVAAIIWPVFCTLYVVIVIALFFKRRRG